MTEQKRKINFIEAMHWMKNNSKKMIYHKITKAGVQRCRWNPFSSTFEYIPKQVNEKDYQNDSYWIASNTIMPDLASMFLDDPEAFFFDPPRECDPVILQCARSLGCQTTPSLNLVYKLNEYIGGIEDRMETLLKTASV